MRLTWARYICVGTLVAALQGQVFVQRDPRWRTVGVGTLAQRPATCKANQHVYMCNGAGCAAAGLYHYCTATDTWADAVSAAITAGNAATATALAGNGANCSAGQYPLGVDASGAVESCTAAPVGDLTAVGDCASGDCHQAATANYVYAGPASGAAAPAALRVLVSADIPANAADTSGTAAKATALAADGGNCSAGYYPLGVDASGAVQSCTAAGGGSHTESSADTLTNKTLDVEGAGNNITTVQDLGFTVATCQMGVASTALAMPSSNYPSATCVEGSNTVYGTLSFAENGAGAAQSIQGRFPLVSAWTGAIDVNATWRTSAIAGDVVWQIRTACVADGETGDPAWNAAQAFTADTAKGTTLQWNDVAQLTGLTTTGCAAGETLLFKVLRDATDAGDTLAAAAELIWVQFKTRRTQ